MLKSLILYGITRQNYGTPQQYFDNIPETAWNFHIGFTKFCKNESKNAKAVGYWGLQTESVNVILPPKNSKLHQLSKKAQKTANRELAGRRVKVENLIRRLKVFRILSERYRHLRKRFGLRLNLIAGLHNYQLKLKS